jgi:HEAT repeat protein
VELIWPLRLLMGTDRPLTEASAQALAAYRGPEALHLLVNFAAARQQREADRVLVIRAIGTVPEKAAAEFLVGLVVREDDAQRIRNAAADALIDATGEYQNGHDGRMWSAWWEQNANKTEDQWREQVRTLQASRYVQMRTQYQQLSSELQTLLTQVYENTVPGQQSPLLLTYMRSAHPEIRRVGAMIIRDEAMAAHPISPECREQLRSMISDTSPEVRLAVANALLATNDAAALDAMLGQLDRETDPQVKAALAAPIASIGDLKAVAALRTLLHDRAISTVIAGAAALHELGAVIRERDPALAKEVAQDLQASLAAFPTGPGSLQLREAVADALTPLREPSMLPLLYRLLSEGASTRIRWAALRGIGELRDPRTADTVARYLEDRDGGVRLAAVRALGKTSSVEFAEEIYRRTSAVEEPDPSVREEAWNVLRQAFSKMSVEQLAGWSNRFANDPAHRLIVLTASLQRHESEKHDAQAAAAHHQIGIALMALDQPADASEEFRKALEWYTANNGKEMLIEQVTEQLLQSLLRARKYNEAGQFGSQLLAQKAAYQQTVGVQFRNEARRLVEDQRSLDLTNLSAAARAITPPLADPFLQDIGGIERASTRPTSQPVTAP